jgi:hypothetical protein
MIAVVFLFPLLLFLASGHLCCVSALLLFSSLFLAAGKTTMLFKLDPSSPSVVTTIPTVGFNVETLDYKQHLRFVLGMWADP